MGTGISQLARKKKFFVVLTVIIGLGLIISCNNVSKILDNYTIIESPDNSSSNFELNQETLPTFVNCTLLKKETVGWLSAYINIRIDSDADILIDYLVTGNGLFSQPVSNIQLAAGSNELSIPIKPTPDKFPGKFSYNLIVFFTNSSSGTPISQIIYNTSGEIRITMGISMLVIVLGITFIGTIVIALKDEKVKNEPTKTTQNAQVYVPNSQTSTPSQPQTQIVEVKSTNDKVKKGFIQCPDCKKEIVEGSAFCPECGFHIPRFLRTQE